MTSPSKLSIVYGTNKQADCPAADGSYSTCQRVRVKKVTVHELYDSQNVVNDLAVYELEKPVSVTLKNGMGSLPATNPPTGTSTFVIGWGLISDADGQAVNELRKGLVPITAESNCNALGMGMDSTKGQLCAGSGNGIDACSGDSGGPLAYQTNNGTWVVAGLVSYGPSGCGVASSRSNRGVYTSVAFFKNWILSKTNSSLAVVDTGGGGGIKDQNNGGSIAVLSFSLIFIVILVMWWI